MCLAPTVRVRCVDAVNIYARGHQKKTINNLVMMTVQSIVSSSRLRRSGATSLQRCCATAAPSGPWPSNTPAQ